MRTHRQLAVATATALSSPADCRPSRPGPPRPPPPSTPTTSTATATGTTRPASGVR
ncbi:hypothetical protein LT493_34415 [Streptomyces tricolor]|nr:hypothetical protein [Streptomyces tricolor]